MLNTIIGIVLIVAALFLIVAILLQSGKDKNLSGAITGGSSETYYGQNKGKSSDKRLAKITAVVAVIFALLVLVSFIIQPEHDHAHDDAATSATTTAGTTTAAGTTAAGTTAAADTTTGDTTGATDTTDSGTTAEGETAADTEA